MGSIKNYESGDDDNKKIEEFELSDLEDDLNSHDEDHDDDDHEDLRDLELQDLDNLDALPDTDEQEELRPLGEGKSGRDISRKTPAKFYGRIRVIRVFGQDCYIGPHWCFSMALLCVMGLITFVFYRLILPGLPWIHVPIGTILILASYLSYFKLLMSDPGVLGKGSNKMSKPFEGIEQFFPSSGSLDCKICEITQPTGSLHCEYCHVCIDGYDHHCPWTSKCIGKANLCLFYFFLVVNFGTFLYIIISAFVFTGHFIHHK